MTPGAHGSTFGGNPLAGAVANAVLDIVMNDTFLADIRRKGLMLRTLMEEIASRYPDLVVEVRGHGLMLGVKTTRSPQEVVERLRTHAKALTIGAGDNVTRVLPPLIVTDEEIHLFTQRLDQSLALLSTPAIPGT